MTYKTILAHCDASPKIGQRLDIAAELARRHSARLIGVYVRTPIDVPAFFDGPMPTNALFAAYEAAAKDAETAAVAAFTKATKGNHLPIEWRVVDGDVDEQLALQARSRPSRVGADRPAIRGARTAGLARIGRAGIGTAGARGALCRRHRQAGQDGHAMLERQSRKRTGGIGRPAVVQGSREGHRAPRRPQVVAGRPWRRAGCRCRDMAGAARRRGRRSSATWPPIPMSAV